MDNVEFDREPPANLTTMVMAFGGWIDAGQAATGALRHLVSDLPAARLARIDPEEFFVFTQERPEVRLRPDGGRDIHWPRSEFFAWDPGMAGTASCCSAARSPISGGDLHEGVPRRGRALWGEADRLARGAAGRRASYAAGPCHRPLHRPGLAVVARSLGHLSRADLRRPDRYLHDGPGRGGATRQCRMSASWGRRRTISKTPRIRRRSRRW